MCCKHRVFPLLPEKVKGFIWGFPIPAEENVYLDSGEDTYQAGSQKENLPKRGRGLASFRRLDRITVIRDFPGGTVVENLPASAGDRGLIPGPGRSHMLRSN